MRLILRSGPVFKDDDVDDVDDLELTESKDIMLELFEMRSLSTDVEGSDCTLGKLIVASSEQTCVRVSLRDLLRCLLAAKLFRRG